MDVEKKIYYCLAFLLDSHNNMVEWDDCGFLKKSSLLIIKGLLQRNPSNWTSKMAFNGWKILEQYKDDLLEHEVSFDEIQKPDHIEDNKIKLDDHNVVNIINGQFIISNPNDLIKTSLNSNVEGDIILDFNISNLYSLFPFFQNNTLKIHNEYYKFINIHLNGLPIDKMYDGFSSDLKTNFNFKLKPFQAIGCLFALLNKRIILGDEMGLGKTIQAIASIEISGKKPCLIVCPNNLKYNWMNEVNKHLKNQKVSFLDNKAPIDSDFYIVNYESLHKCIDFINKIKPVSVIMDESHYLKNQNAKRTKYCLSAINNIEYRFALTGTPILKSPIDIVSQLKVINKLDYFGSENIFIDKFCGNSNTKWGKDVRKGASNLKKLNRELREICFLRREKISVMKDLPDKTRTYISMEINSKKYKEMSKEFSKLKRFEKLEKIEKLRQLAANEKMDSVKEWIDNFKESEKKLVVFAYHTEIQEKLLKLYPESARICSGMSDLDKENNKNRFMQNDDCKIIICSLKSGSVGLTLTSASDVLFVEFDWCAANNSQAEDRCHRIGQKNAVNVWYLVAKDTIEEYICSVVENKRELIDKIYSNPIEENFSDYDVNLLQLSIIDEVILKIESEESNKNKSCF